MNMFIRSSRDLKKKGKRLQVENFWSKTIALQWVVEDATSNAWWSHPTLFAQNTICVSFLVL